MKGRLRIDLGSLLPLLALVLLGLFINQINAAPAVDEEETDGGCYYMFNHYGEGDRILTNEPCLNCTCHNSMLMCYLRVCPFTKPIGQDCTIEKKPDQCCPVISCPEEDVRIHTDQKKHLVPVSLLTQSTTSTTTQATTSLAPWSDSTELVPYERGCEMNGKYYSDGAQVDGDPSKPCELCYCIRNQTACVMQECILHVEGCEPVFQPGVCCPVRYRCDYPPQITDESSSTIASVITTTIASIFQTTPQPGGCYRGGEYFADGSQIPGAEPSPCEHCYCMRGEVVCAVQECGTPLENVGNCTAVPPPPGHCCPEKYTCGDDDEISADEALSTPESIVGESASSTSSPVAAPVETQTEFEPIVQDATTVFPSVPSESPVSEQDTQRPEQADQPDATEGSPAATTVSEENKLAVEPSTSSPSDTPVDQQDEDVVQTPTETTVPPIVVPADEPATSTVESGLRPEVPTEPSVVPGATDSPSQADESSSGVTEQEPDSSSPSFTSSSPSSSPSTEVVDDIILGTTNAPEPIPSENLQRPSSERPSNANQDEPSQVSTVLPEVQESTATNVPTTQSPTTKGTTIAADMPEILDVGSSSEEMDGKPSEPSVTASTQSPSDIQTVTSSDIVSPSTDVPVSQTSTEKELSQQDDDIPETTKSSPSDTHSTESSQQSTEAESAVDVTTVAPSQSDSQSTQDEAVQQQPQTSEKPSDDDTSAVVTETAGMDESSATQSSSVQPEFDATTRGPAVQEDDNKPVNDASPTDESQDTPTTLRPQQDEGISTNAPVSSSSGADEPSVQPISDDDKDVVSTVSPDQVIPEQSTSSPISSDGTEEDDNAIQQTTTKPSIEEEEPSDQSGSSVSVTSEQPAPESSTKGQDEPVTEGLPQQDATSASDSVDDESSVQTTASPNVTPVGVPAGASSSTDLPQEESSTTAQEISSSTTPSIGSTDDAPEPTSSAPQVDSATNEAVSDGVENETEQPIRESTSTPSVPEGSSPSTSDSATEISNDQAAGINEQPFPVDSTVAPDTSDRITTSPSISDDDTSEPSPSSPSSSIPSQEGSTSLPVDQEPTTVAPASSQSEAGEGSQDQSIDDDKTPTTEVPSGINDASISTETQQTTPSESGVADISTSDISSPSTDRPLESLPSDTTEPASSDDSNTEAHGDSTTARVPSAESPSSEPSISVVDDEPERTTVVPIQEPSISDQPSSESSTADSVSDQSASTDSSSISESGSAISTEQPSSSVTDQSSTPSSSSTEGGEVIGMESVSNSPDGSENLSKTSTAPPMEVGSVAPIGSPEDNEIISDPSSVEDQDSYPSMGSSEPSFEMSSSTQVPVSGEEASSSSSIDESSSTSESTSASSSSGAEESVADERESTAPVDNVSGQSSTESGLFTTSSTTRPDFDNELIPEEGSQKPVEDQPEVTPDSQVSTQSPTEGDIVSEGEQPTTVSASPASGDDSSVDAEPSTSSPVQSSEPSSEISTMAPQQDESRQPSSDSSVPPAITEEPSATTSSPPQPDENVSSDGSSDDQVTSKPISGIEEGSSTFSPDTDVSSESSSSSPEMGQESGADITSKPDGAESDDAQTEPTTESAPIQPESPASSAPEHPADIEQTSTTASPAAIVSDVKDQQATDEVSSPAPTTVQPETSTPPLSPEDGISNDDRRTESPADGISEPDESTQPPSFSSTSSSIQQQPEDHTSAAVVSDEHSTSIPEELSPTTVAPSVPSHDVIENDDDSQASTTISPEQNIMQDVKDEQVQTSTPGSVSINEGSTVDSQGDDEHATTSKPAASSPGFDDQQMTTIQPDMPSSASTTEADQPAVTSQSETSSQAPSDTKESGDQVSDEPAATTTVSSDVSASSSTPASAASAETEAPEDSDEVRHPDDNTGDEGSVVTTVQPDSSTDAPSIDDAPPSQQDSTDAPELISVPQQESTEQVVEATTTIPEGVSSSSQSSGPVQDETETGSTETSVITEQPISVQPDAPASMMSSTEKVEMDDGSSTPSDISGDEDTDSMDSSTSIPGEGSCYVEGRTYGNGSSIPPSTPCHIACACKNSIVHCLLVHCPPPPSAYVDCKPVYRTGVCCPEYDCGPQEDTSVTVTPQTPTDDKDGSVVTVTPEASSKETSEPASDYPAPTTELPSGDEAVSSSSSSSPSESLITESTERPGGDSAAETGIQDQPSEAGESSSTAPVSVDVGSTTAAPTFPVDEPAGTTILPSDLVSSTDISSSSTTATSEQQPQQDDDDNQPDITEPSVPVTTTTSDRPTDIQQIMESSSNAPSDMDVSGSDTAPEEDESSSIPPGSQYPVTTTTTVTPSSAPWPYPTSSTPSPSAMSSGACLFDGRVYMSAQQIPREDPCDFCFCFRGDIICLQQSCPPPIPGCYEEPIPGFCCPRYECPVGNGNHTTPPPLFPPSYYHNQILNGATGNTNGQNGSGMSGSVPSGPGCEIQGEYFETGQVITSTSGPCLECRCGSTGMMECDPRECQPEPMLRKMIAAITSRKR